MNGQQIKKKLERCEYVYGTHVVGLVNPLIPEWEKDCGLDFAFICNEHMPLDRSETSAMCKMYASHGVSPIVRIPYPDARLATIAVEGGAEGIVAPYVEKVEDIIAIVAALKYRPIKGEFLNQICSGEREPSETLSEYMKNLNRNQFFVVGIESVPAIERLEELINIDGVSAVFLGCHDISCSMELPCDYSNPRFIDMITNVVSRCRAAGVSVGAHIEYTNPIYRQCIEAGMNFIINAADVTTAISGLKSSLDFVRENFEK